MITVEVPARPEAIKLPLEATALLVVDMQNGYLSKGGYLDLIGTDVSPAPKAIKGTLAVIEAARAAGLRIIYLQNGFSLDQREVGGEAAPVFHKSAALRYMRRNPDYRGKLITRGSWDFDFVEGIEPRPGETVIVKARYSGFAGTNLDETLRGARISHLVFAGVNTNVCVESTLRDAFHREYFALMVADATYQSGPPAMFDATVFNVQRFFGWVSTTAEFCSALMGQKPQ
jgi:ureidoacrylate peracid hydrolase